MTDFCGHPVATLQNDQLRLEYLSDVGPRVARLFFSGGNNLLAELPDLFLDTSYGRFEFMGGHRLWFAPEELPGTYVPDQPVVVENIPNGVRITASAQLPKPVSKSMDIQLAEQAAKVTVRHSLRNMGTASVVHAPWALTMFRLGGTLILPQPEGKPDSLLPNRWLALWPYTRINDPRIKLDDDYALVHANAGLPAAKIGTYNQHGWVAYWLEGVLALKRFAVLAMDAYPDGGCNVEAYCNDRFIEMETLGPLTTLAPGEDVTFEESWEFYPGLDQSLIPETLRERLL